ncbi:MAG: nitrogen fixation regulation protein FixK [Tardiphaga sp.]|nr:nitrogen fixation regulation protein FixK [Tardiphaga sp.]
MHTLSSITVAQHLTSRAALSRHVDAFGIANVGTPMRYARNAEIYGDEEEAEYLYQVVSGAVRTHKILADGRRQIGDFYLPGDIFGLEFDDHHEFSAEAICNSTVMSIKRQVFRETAGHDARLSRELWSATKRQLKRAEKHALLLVLTAQERVAAFLLEMLERSGKTDSFELPMSRQDIADYLGMTIETVSRTVTAFETDGTIALPSARCIVIRKHQALRALDS